MGKSVPKPPDYAALAKEQAKSSRDVTEQQTWANRPDQYTPFGQTTWDQQREYDPTTGQYLNKWTQNTALNEQSQAALDSQLEMTRSRSDLANSLTGRMENEFGEQMDWSQFGEMGGVPEAGQYGAEDLQRSLSLEGMQGVDSSQRYNQQAGDALYNRATSRLDPQWEQRSEQKEVALRNQGLAPGDQAYDTAMANMENQRTDAYQQAGYGADIGAGQEAARYQGMDMGLRGQQFGERGAVGQFGNAAAGQAFSMGLAGGGQEFGEQMASSNLMTQQRQQQIAEEMQRRGFSLNEMNAIMSGQQVGMPAMPNFQNASRSEGLQSLQAGEMQNQANMDAFSAQQAQTQMAISGVTDLAGAMPMSDRRMKTDIEYMGEANGNRWYSYKLFGHIPEAGVMSDEINPKAVVRLAIGYDTVNYGEI